MNDIRARVLQAQKLQSEIVETKAWGSLIVTEIDTESRLSVFRKISEIGEKNLTDLLAMAIIMVACTVDEKGIRIFEDDDAYLLVKKNEDDLKIVYDKAAELNGIEPAEDIAGK